MRRLLLFPALMLLAGCDDVSEMAREWRTAGTVYAVASCIEKNKLVRDVSLNFDVQAECVRRHQRVVSFNTLGRSTGGMEGCFPLTVERSRAFGVTVRNDSGASHVLTSGYVTLTIHEGNRAFVSTTETMWVPPGGQQEVTFRFGGDVPCADTRNVDNNTAWGWQMHGLTGVAATLR